MLLSFSCPHLHYLSLRNCKHVTDGGIESIINIFSLISVDLSGTSISNEVKKMFKNSYDHFVNNGQKNNSFYFLNY